MAEVVQSNIEDTLPEVYELQQLGILSSSEAKSVIRDRTRFEYMMRRRISKKQDIMKYIEFELKLEKLKQHRISSMGLQDISEGARYRSLQRIHFLFQKCLKKHKSDISLWMRYIKYCKEVKSNRSLSLAFTQALKHNPNCVKIWILSAKTEMETNKNMSAARLIFLQGIKFNPASVHLWIEYFRLEVLHAEKLQKRHLIMNSNDRPSNQNDQESGNFLDYKTAKIVYKNALENIELQVEEISSFVSIAKFSQNGDKLSQFILESALQKYPMNADVWIVMAKHVIAADPYAAIEILKTAVKTLPDLACLSKIIIFIIEHREKIGDFGSSISQLCVNIEKMSITTPHSALTLAKVLVDNQFTNLSNEIISLSQEKFPKNKSLWMFKIDYLSVNPVDDLEKALVDIPDDIDVWKKYLTLLASVDVSKCKDRWEKVIQNKFSEPLIGDYLEFVYCTGGFDELSKAFHHIKNTHSISEPAFKSFLKFKILSDCNPESVCTTFDVFTEQYSSDENWKWYLEFCQDNCPEKLSAVSWKCNKKL